MKKEFEPIDFGDIEIDEDTPLDTVIIPQAKGQVRNPECRENWTDRGCRFVISVPADPNRTSANLYGTTAGRGKWCKSCRDTSHRCSFKGKAEEWGVSGLPRLRRTEAGDRRRKIMWERKQDSLKKKRAAAEEEEEEEGQDDEDEGDEEKKKGDNEERKKSTKGGKGKRRRGRKLLGRKLDGHLEPQ